MDGDNLIFTNKTLGKISTSDKITSNIGTVTETEGVNRKNGTTTLTVTKLPPEDACPLELEVDGKTYRICYSSSDIESDYDIKIGSTTTAAQLASLLERKFSDADLGDLLTSLSGSGVILSAGEIVSPSVVFDSEYFSVAETAGNEAIAETFTLAFPEITEGMIISITVNGRTMDFQAHDCIYISQEDPAYDIKKVFNGTIYYVSALNGYTLVFQSRLLGSAGNSQQIETSGAIVSEPSQTAVGKDTKLGSANITVSKIPKYGDALVIDSVTYTFSGTSDDSYTIDISDCSTVYEVAKAIKLAIGSSATTSGSKITIASGTAEAPEIEFIAS